MLLEQVFQCQRTLAGLRNGPLGKELDGFCDWLLTCGFSRYSVRKHLANVGHVGGYLAGPTAPPRTTVGPDDIAGVLKVYPSRCPSRRPIAGHLARIRHSLNRFTQYLRDKTLFDPPLRPARAPACPESIRGAGRSHADRPPIYEPLLNAYLEWLRDSQHAAPSTLRLRSHSLRKFLSALGQQATPEGLSELTADRVESFFVGYAQAMGRASRRDMQSALRTFFRFCSHHGYILCPLDRAVPTLRTYKLSSVPRGITEAQAHKVLRCVNRNTHAGRRNYAILLLLSTYGVRGCQVRSLRLDDINWAQNQILFRAAKNGKDSLLPLTRQVGEALLDYLRNARPRRSSPHVFLTCCAPYRPVQHACIISDIVRHYICAAGIDLVSKGSHVFRHGLAARMLHQGHSLKTIADVLGHRDIRTSFIYTKVDFDALKQVALQWPKEVHR